MPEPRTRTARFDRGVAIAVAAALLLMAGAAWAAISSHDPWKLREVRVDGTLVADAVGQCENCHTLDTTEGDPNTSYINYNARTLPQMRAFGGVPAYFGCTFCHTGVTDNVYMNNALKDFEFTPPGLKHPIGITLAGVNNNQEYYSSAATTPQVNQLHCIECHDPALLAPGGVAASYPYHEGRTTDPAGWTGIWDKAANPYALRNAAALGDERRDHCVSTCHGDLGGGNSATKPMMGHLGWGAYDGTTLFEPRGEPILQGNCGVCHDFHNSSQNFLLGDGQAQVTTGVNPAPPPDLLKSAETAIAANDCTLTCHVGRDPASAFRTQGHGKLRDREDEHNIAHSYTICTPCHTSAVDHRTPGNEQRFGMTEDTTLAGIPHDGSANGLDDNYDGVVDDAGEAPWYQPAVSICQNCHSNYNAHGGDVNGSTSHFVSASCLDCHDPHGKDVGGNIEMVRATIAGEPTTFVNTTDVAGLDDFYRNWGGGDRNGVCDNTACHGRDLAAILADATINDHVGVQAGDNCTGCHLHAGTGGPSFQPNCNVCHGYPPASGGLPDYQQGIGVHQRHVTQLLLPCSECHYRDGGVGNTHNESAWPEPPGTPVPRVNVDVVFDTHGGTVNMNATYTGYNDVTGTMDGTFGAVWTCQNVTCHNPDSNVGGTGLTGKSDGPTTQEPAWADAYTPINACTDCHVESPATNPDGGSHYKHDNTTDGKGFPCQTCHQTYWDAVNLFNTAGGNHSNRTLQTSGIVDINANLNGQAVTGTWNDGGNSCAGVYCHGTTLGAGGDQTTPVWGPGASRSGGLCGDCHDADPVRDTTAPQDYISTGNHTAHVNAPQGPNVSCGSCHPAWALNSPEHVDGERDFLNLDDTTVVNDFAVTDACNNCHGTSVAEAKDPTNWATGTYRLPCLQCHDGSANSARDGLGVTAPPEDAYWNTSGHGHAGPFSATGNSGPNYACTVCHDETAPHISGTLGDADRFRPVNDDGLAYTSDVTEVCLDCHAPGQSSPPSPPGHLNRDATSEASVHSGAITGNYDTLAEAAVAFPAYGNAANYTASPGYQCEACHNPHGTTKLAMVKPALNGGFGDALDVAVGAGFDYGTGSLAGLDPAGPNNGVCDACHRNTGNTDAHPDSPNVANNHNYGQVCIDCHDHRNSFFASCTDCHGGGTVGAVRANYWPDGAVGPNTAGAHADHVADLAMRIYGQSVAQLLDDPASDARQKHLCKYCHGANPGQDADHGYTANLPAEVTASLGRLWDPADPPALTDAVTYNLPAGTRTCQLSECHYDTTTPGWLSGTAATCTTCHNNGTNDGAVLNAWVDLGTGATGDHFAHYTRMSGVLTDCSPCHSGTQPANMAAIVTTASHIDGDRFNDTSFPAAYDDKSAGVPLYTVPATPNEANGTCADVSCHGGQVTPPWQTGNIDITVVTTVECQRCHARVDGLTNPTGTEYNDARSGAHIDHDHGCAACHSAAPTSHYAGIATLELDNPDNIGNVGYSVEYTDTTNVAVNPLTNGWFNDATTAGGVSGTCATVTCHYNQPTVAWDVDLTSDCNLCHLDSPTSNSHQAHVYNGATPDHTDCDSCHSSATYSVAASGTAADFLAPGLHANGTIELVAGIGASGSGGTTACATACHARETTTTWDNTTVPLTCNSCHYHEPAPAAANNVGVRALGGTHNPHFFGAPTNIVCSDCHADNSGDTVAKRTHMQNAGATDAAILQNKAVAVQDEADVVAAALGTGSDPDPGNPTCNTALCHNPTPGAAYSAIWTGPPNNSCGFCHADTTGDPGSGSHSVHIGYDTAYAPCAQCHVDNGTTYTHMTRQVELAAGFTYSASLAPPYDAGSWGSCTAGACHDTDLDPAWGSAVLPNDCHVCHVDNNAVPASSADSPNFSGNDRVASRVGIGAEWTALGHSARGLGCTSCHDGGSVTHQPDFATSTNPFRLVGPSGYTTPDAFCSNTTSCHTGAAVPGSDLVITHANELMTLDQRTWPSWDPKCVDCHDPHGDGTNIKMISTDVFDRGSSTHGVPTATLNGIPRTADVVDFVLRGAISPGSYADDSAGADGICQECHLANDGVATGLLSFQDDNLVPLAPTGNHPTNNLGPCTQCHKHDKAFEPAGCNGCHGSTLTGQYWPDGQDGSPPYVDDAGVNNSGSHDAHMLAISQYLYGQNIAQLLADAATDTKQKTICAFCHPDPGSATHTTNAGAGVYANRVDVWFDTQNDAGGGSNYFQVFKVGAAVTGNDAGTNGTYDTNTLRCSNVDCHYNKPTPAYAGQGWNAGDANALDCESCHYFRGTAAVGGPYPTVAYVTGGLPGAGLAGGLPDSHQAHVAGIVAPNDAQSRDYTCSVCHTIPTATAHTNGQLELSTAGNPTLLRDGNGADETMTPGGGGLAVKFGTNAATVCTNMYCHGADFGSIAGTEAATQGNNVAPTWNQHLTGACGRCHDVDTRNTPNPSLGTPAGAFAEGKHRTHMRPETGFLYGPYIFHADGCPDCHGIPAVTPALSAGCNAQMCHPVVGTEIPGGAGDLGWASYPSRSHVTGAFEVDFENLNRGYNFTSDYDGTPGTVSPIGTAYDNGTDICNRCHSTATFNATIGATLAKQNWNTAAYRLLCRSCHNAGGAAYSTPVVAGVQAPNKETNYQTAGHGKVTPTAFGGDACVDCHAENSGHLSGALGDDRLDPVNGQNYATDANAFCASACHAVIQPVHYANTQTAGGTSDNGTMCSICHDPHGPSGQDAMVNGTIAGRTVSGFANKALRSSYFNLSSQGVCQVCHDPAEVSYFNRTSGATDVHNNGPVCTVCHAHDNAVAFQPNCADCHGDIGGTVRGDGSYYPPEGPVAARSGGTQNWAETAASPATVGNHQTHAVNYAPCQNCHTTTPGLGADHNDDGTNATMSEIGAWGTWNPGAQPGVTSVVDDYCTVTCHNNLGFPGVYSPANPSYVRYWNSNWDCYACHAYDGAADSTLRPGDQTATPADWMNSNSHDVHINRSTGYAMVCTECHVNNVGNNNHRGGTVDFAANFGATRLGASLGGHYDADGIAPFVSLAPATSTASQQAWCADVYCHSTGEPRGATESIAYFPGRWANAGTADCGDCHGVDGAGGAIASQTSNVHGKHTGSAAGQYTYRCETCHNGVVSWGGASYTVTSRTLHVNNVNNVAFAANEGSYSLASGGTVGDPGGICSAVYCHSQGLDWTAPYTTAAANAPTLEADWDRGAGSLGCYGCHGDGAVLAYPVYPNNTNVDPGSGVQQKRNSHVSHAAFTCNFCHNATTTDGSNITTVANHGNRAWNLLQGGGATFTVSVQGNMTANSYTPTTCTGISCHNGGTAQWGTTLQCSDCHFAASDVDNWDISDGTGAAISSTEWAAAGHGRPSASGAYPGGNPAAAFAGPATDSQGCAYCHNPAVSHGTATNPFRLANRSGALEDGGWNNVCLVCHLTGDPGYDPDGGAGGYTGRDGTLDVDENHYGTKHSAPTQGGTFCWDCHDPHGDSQHLMVQLAVTDVSDGTYGVPASTRPVTGLDVVAGGYTSADLANAANTGLCQTCHASSGGANYYTRSLFTPLASHNGASGTLCTECHTHPRDFAPLTCEECHDNTPFVKGSATAPNVMGPNGTYAGTGVPTPKPYDDATWGYNVNGHGRDDTPDRPGNAIDAPCTGCHDLNQDATSHIDGVLNGRLSPDTRTTNSFHLLAAFVDPAPSSEWDQQVTFDNACWTTCHSGATSDMRHAIDAVPAANAAEFGTHATYSEPMNTPPPDMFYDRNLRSLGGYDGTPNYALCVTCHNPHGTDVASPRADGNNKMVIYRWSSPSTLCAACHL